MSANFWYLQGPQRDRELATWAHDVELDLITCPLVEDHKRTGKRLTKLSIILPSGPTKDFVWTWAGDLLVTEHCLAVLQSSKITGFEVKGAKVTHKHPSDLQPPKLYEFVVTGWAGLAAPESGLSLTNSCPACGDLEYSIANPVCLIDASSWDGSDIFIVWPLPLFRFADDRTADVIRREKLTGIKLLKASDVPLRRGVTLGPGRLSQWMPEERARDLGEPLGIY
jgi:hypothetical protein